MIRIGIGLLFLALFSACVSTGRISIGDKRFFKESPRVVIADNRYFVTFRYADGATGPFYMSTAAKIREGKLILFIPATTSSGDVDGRLQMEEIRDPDKISLIKQGQVYWEYQEQLTPMRVESL